MPSKSQHLEMLVGIFLVIGALIACQPGEPSPLVRPEESS